MFLVLLYIMHHSLVLINLTLRKHKLFWIEICFGVLAFLVNLQTQISIISQRNFLYLQLPVFVLKLKYDVIANEKILLALLFIWLIIFQHCHITLGLKKSRRLSEKTHKGKSPAEIKKYYWENDFYKLMKAKRSENFNKFKSIFKLIKLIWRDN